MEQIYDTIVIGAGIAGASTAYYLHQKGQRVLVLDKRGIAKGGSGAAGAFVSPKIGKGSPLQKLSNEAFLYAKDFYLQNFSDHYHPTGVVRIPKDSEDASKFDEYQNFNTNKYGKLSSEQLKQRNINTPFDGFCFEDAGACDAVALCEALLDGIEFQNIAVCDLLYDDKHWSVEGYRCRDVVIAAGFENSFFDMRYMGVRGTWGTRGDFATQTKLDLSLHQSISISANMGGVIKLGATHEKSIKSPIECQDSQAVSLQERAKELIDISDFRLLESFCGMRSGSKDYFPLIGSVVDVAYMLESCPKITQGARIKEPIKKIEHLYVCNGLGARGFVFGPMMGRWLADLIADGVAIDPRVDPDRLFLRWCRRDPSLEELR